MAGSWRHVLLSENDGLGVDMLLWSEKKCQLRAGSGQ